MVQRRNKLLRLREAGLHTHWVMYQGHMICDASE